MDLDDPNVQSSGSDRDEMSSRILDLATPALILDRRALQRNTQRMSERMRQLGVALRPHMKTAKCAEVARLATAGHFGGITVSTLNEARWFLEHGFQDITYAVGIVPAKLDEVAALRRKGARVRILLDDVRVARALGEFAAFGDHDLHVLIEVDTGQHRAGVPPDAPELLEIAHLLHGAPGVTLAGVLTHAGHSYHCKSVDEVRTVAEQERRGVVLAAERLRQAGLPCPTVSAGSTPTAMQAASLAGVTEMRPGNYVFFDLFQVGAGSCTMQDLALSVLATVIGHAAQRDHALVDAGSLALSADTSAAEHMPGIGYGLVLDVVGRTLPDRVRVARVNQEHGFLQADGPIPFDALPIGAKVRIFPNHACITAAMFDRYHVTDDGETIAETWRRTNGW